MTDGNSHYIHLSSRPQSVKGGGHYTDEKTEVSRGQLICLSHTAHRGRLGTISAES